MPEEPIAISQDELDRLLSGFNLEPEKYTEYTKDDLSSKYRTLLNENLEADCSNPKVAISQQELDRLFS
ncbi:hypothetical protein [Treponema zioleckii]|uniref:hypothetical protein n=1 Tax=Treponema zioleckii TaxID=331680 RepID=UPI00168A85B4|nr:hypothetical protein [Treponema zioleckii]